MFLSIQMGQLFYGNDHMFKVRKSMARLLTVVNERKKVRTEYRQHLEREYILEKKAEEYEEQKEAVDAKREQDGFYSTPLMHDEIATLMKEKEAKRKEFRDTAH